MKVGKLLENEPDVMKRGNIVGHTLRLSPMLAGAGVAFDDELQRWIGASVFYGATSEGWSGTWNRHREGSWS
jgi:hypothetical protein